MHGNKTLFDLDGRVALVTGGSRGLGLQIAEALGEESLMGNAPLRRLGGDEDVKGAALLFASDAGQHITGQVLAVDGGYTAV